MLPNPVVILVTDQTRPWQDRPDTWEPLQVVHNGLGQRDVFTGVVRGKRSPTGEVVCFSLLAVVQLAH